MPRPIYELVDVKDDSIPVFDGIVIGTPVHWANVSVESRRFVDRLGAALAKTKVLGEGRTAGVFCTASNVVSGKEMARLSLIAAMLALRFVVIGGVDEEGYGTMGPQATTAAGDPGISNKELEELQRRNYPPEDNH
jgi:multimeric flavodoxin WrbA